MLSLFVCLCDKKKHPLWHPIWVLNSRQNTCFAKNTVYNGPNKSTQSDDGDGCADKIFSRRYKHARP